MIELLNNVIFPTIFKKTRKGVQVKRIYQKVLIDTEVRRGYRGVGVRKYCRFGYRWTTAAGQYPKRLIRTPLIIFK